LFFLTRSGADSSTARRVVFFPRAWLSQPSCGVGHLSTKATAAELSPQDAILFTQGLDRVLLLLIHPSRYRNEEKSEQVQPLWHRFAGYHRSPPAAPSALSKTGLFRSFGATSWDVAGNRTKPWVGEDASTKEIESGAAIHLTLNGALVQIRNRALMGGSCPIRLIVIPITRPERLARSPAWSLCVRQVCRFCTVPF
jgi:hypothetical protein